MNHDLPCLLTRACISSLALGTILCTAQAAATAPDGRGFAEATKKAITTGTWTEQKQFLDTALLSAIKAVPASSDPRRYDKLLSNPVLAEMLAQDVFIQSVTPSRLDKMTNGQDFVQWLLTDASAMEAYVIAVKPGDVPEKVFEVWHALWKSDPDGRDKYKDLALACALVFDGPLVSMPARAIKGASQAQMNVSDRYAFFRDSDMHNKLKTQLSELPVWELVWVVDAPVSNEELSWAQTHVNYARNKWGDAYGSIEYRMDMVTKGEQPYETYSLKEILKEGGICVDQGYFAAVSAKANGIPAMLIVGKGQRGGHAWFGFKESSKQWNMTAGRYTTDDYATGTTVDPQTGSTMKEQDLYPLADEQRRSPNYLTAWRLVWLARIAGAQPPAARGALLEAALATSSRHVDAWKDYIAYLSETKAPADKWRQVVKTLKATFHNYPDMVAFANAVEREHLVASQGADKVATSLAKEAKKLSRDEEGRTDLVLAKISEQVDVLCKSGKTNEVHVVYKKALDQYGKEVVAFEQLATDYFDLASKAQKSKDALRVIERAFKRHYGSGTGDYFAMKTRARMMRMIAGFYTEAGDTKQAARYNKDADKLQTAADSAQGKL
jgi:hypothetical protein